MTTLADRARALEPIGFSPRQARFLATVALHSGYCLRRQYEVSAGVRYGKNVRAFLDDLVARRLAERSVRRADRGHVYHLHERRLYRLIGLDSSRHRRRVSAAGVARRLMVLDHVLATPGTEWLATDADKVAFFVEHLGMAPSALPQQVCPAARTGGTTGVRYFPHRWPIAAVGQPPVVQFVALVTDALGRTLERFLADHAALLGSLPVWTVVAVAPKTSTALATCHDTLQRFLARPRSTVGSRIDDIRWHFTTRRAVEHGEWARLSVADLDRFRGERQRLESADVDALYRDWLVRGEAALQTSASGSGGSAGRLITAVLPFDYSQFGSLPGVA
ncbi:MAG: hypothetical protein ABS36_06320 [Acidobacteria bacterium SCN 69-37]|nr:MAG: hypothetical protein ABS36_06320 [Acidobacteria bacterium SCN 69-37]